MSGVESVDTSMIGAGQAHGWQLEGHSPDAYEEFLVPAIFAPWAQALVDLACPRPWDRVLDVACGTGVVARAAAPRVAPGGTVTSIDVNEGMLATARRSADAGIDRQQADTTRLPFPDASFEVVLCQQGLQVVADRTAAAHEMRRVLTDTGRLAVSVWREIGHSHGYELFADALERHAGRAGEMMRAPFAFGDREALRGLLLSAGFGHVHVVIETRICRFPSPAEFLRQEALASMLAEPLGELDSAAREALVADVEVRLAPYVDDGGLTLPIESHVALATP